MLFDEFNELSLVGGTALALQIGHRQSVDIDLFGRIDFDFQEIGDKLKSIGEVQHLSQSRNINILSIDGIKVDFVNYRYPWIADIIVSNNIRMASKQDIAAMKLNAITGRGSKKDFIDLYYLLKQYSMSQLYDFYTQKFDDGNLFLVKKSLLYFVDADNELMPQLTESISWYMIKDEIKQKMLI